MISEDDDKVLALLREENPVSDAEAATGERPGERERVRKRALGYEDRQRTVHGRPGGGGRGRFALAAAALGGIGIATAFLLIGNGSTGSGPEPALAIESTQKEIRLTIKDPTASEAEMNAELAAAGIDRVRVLSVSGPRKSAGTWAGYLDFYPGWGTHGPQCAEAPTRFGDFGVYFPIVREHATGNFFHSEIPNDTGALLIREDSVHGAGDTVRLNTKTLTDPSYSPKVLIVISPNEHTGTSGEIGVDRLISLGGLFATYGHAVEDGQTNCHELGMTPGRPCPSWMGHPAQRKSIPPADRRVPPHCR